MKNKFTPWFPPSKSPSRVGWYQIRFNDKIPRWRFWTGYEWIMGYGDDVCTDPVCRLIPQLVAKSAFGRPEYERNEAWRGLAEKPE